MDRTATGKIIAGKVEEPAIGVPGPVGDGIVDDSGPEEHEDNGREDAASVGYSTDGKSRTVGVSTISLRALQGTHVMAANMPW